MRDLRTHIERINPVKETPMTDAQFAELKALLTELLTPGYELSKIYLAQRNAPVPELSDLPKADDKIDVV